MVGSFFARASSPCRASGLIASPSGPGSKGLEKRGGWGRSKDLGATKRSAPRISQCAPDCSDPDSLVFGEDIAMDRVVEFLELAVVGRARGRRLGTVFLRSWVDNSWGTKLSSFPSIRLLAKGWFSFLFKASSDVSWVLSKTWTMVGTPIVLKR
jgi:hypothetical protein